METKTEEELKRKENRWAEKIRVPTTSLVGPWSRSEWSMKEKNLWKRNLLILEWKSESVIDVESVRMKWVSCRNHKAVKVMRHGETGEVMAHEMS